MEEYTITLHNFALLEREFHCPYLKLDQNYIVKLDNPIELFLTKEEITDLKDKIKILQLE